MKRFEVFEAKTAEDFEAARQVILEYASWLGFDLKFQGFEKELSELSQMYGPERRGAMLLAKTVADDGGERKVVGCVGIRRIDGDTAEMKRMFVRQEAQGLGIGRALGNAFVVKCRELGFKRARLDSLKKMAPALKLYESLGFREIPPYRFSPMPDAVFLELIL